VEFFVKVEPDGCSRGTLVLAVGWVVGWLVGWSVDWFSWLAGWLFGLVSSVDLVGLFFDWLIGLWIG
jgi:hypothetical protein